jgi:Tol biopolymer transport system component
MNFALTTGKGSFATFAVGSVAPDGKWVSYTMTTIDSLKDSRNSDIWMVSMDGSQDIQLTSSPDGRYLSFLSARQESKGSQIWLMDRRGGEGKRLTEIKGGVDDYAWSPDSRQLLLTLTDPDPEDTGKIKTTKPYVINRYPFPIPQRRRHPRLRHLLPATRRITR